MSSCSDSLGTAFRAARACEISLRNDDEADVALTAALGTTLARARQVHPDLIVEDTRFAHYLGERVEGMGPPSVALEAAPAADLYLACACLSRDPIAFLAFDRLLHRAAHDAVARYCSDPRDVLQSVSEKLLVGMDGGPARLADYGGKGELATWLRVIAVRAAISQARRRGDATLDDDLLWSLESAEANPGQALQRRHSVSAVKQAFQAGIAELDAKERLLLRQHLLDDLSIDEIGPMHGVHRVTAARWLSKARMRLWNLVKRRLQAELGLDPREVESLLEDVRSSLDLSIERVLAEP